MSGSDPEISVVVAAYHSDAVIAGCLEALRGQRHGSFETIVVNSSPEDRTRAIVTTKFPDVRFVESATRLLPHAARNRGVAVASGRLLVFTDADCRPAPDWLERLAQAQAEGHEVVCGSIEPAGSSWFELGVHLCKYSFRLSTLRGGPCVTAGTANACYSRRVWDAVGPFDGDRFSGDGLLSWRAAARGFVPWFEPRALVRHSFRHSLQQLWNERFERGADYGLTRPSFERWSRMRLLGYLLALPLLPWVQLARGGRDALAAGWGARFAATAPLQLLGHLAWSAGEAREHWGLLSARGLMPDGAPDQADSPSGDGKP